MNDCRCYIEHGKGDIEKIIQCSLCAAAPDLLAACELALREWYPRLDGCACPDCLVCARHTKEKEQVEVAITKAKQ